MEDRKKLRALQRKILSWYATNKRALPWRSTKDPYRILVSEVMLQQTQVERVTPFYERWLRRFPTMESLAKATSRSVLRQWSGLGYNSRALRLKALAEMVVQEHQGKLPKKEEELCRLPGIGSYTARAILAFAHNKEVPVIDTNIRRVLIKELGLPSKTTHKHLEGVARQLIPKEKSREWHNALMDYGARVHTSAKTGIRPEAGQTAFQGSVRQARGMIVRMLLNEKSLDEKSLQKAIRHPRAGQALRALKKEGVIRETGGKIRLA